MFDHVSIGVRDVARTKRFYDAALKPLGYACLSEGKDSLGYGAGEVGLWIGASQEAGPCRHGIGSALLLRRADARERRRVPCQCAAAPAESAMASRACGKATGPTTTRPSWSIRTATGSRPIARSLPEGACDSANRLLAAGLDPAAAGGQPALSPQAFWPVRPPPSRSAYRFARRAPGSGRPATSRPKDGETFGSCRRKAVGDQLVLEDADTARRTPSGRPRPPPCSSAQAPARRS